MRVAMALYEGFTVLDVVGSYQVLSTLPGVEVVLVAERAGPVLDDTGGAALVARSSFEEVDRAEVVFVPGGQGHARHLEGGPVREWVTAVDATSTWTVSVCVGSLILASAGLLRGRRATTHWLAVEQLPGWGVVPDPGRVVFDGKYVSAAGVSAGIDMALALAERLAGRQVAELVQLVTEYDPAPHLGAGSPEVAPPEVVALARAHAGTILRGV